jgi:hypothetical protein
MFDEWCNEGVDFSKMRLLCGQDTVGARLVPG